MESKKDAYNETFEADNFDYIVNTNESKNIIDKNLIKLYKKILLFNKHCQNCSKIKVQLCYVANLC